MLDALEAVSIGVAKSPTIEQSDCFIFTDDYVCAYDGNTFCRHPFALGLGTLVVPAEPMMAAAKAISNPQISYDGKQLILKAKRKRAGITCHEKLVLPIHKITLPDEWKPLPADFLAAINTAAPCLCKSDELFVLTCFHLTEQYVESSDNMQILRWPWSGFDGEYLLRGAGPIGAARRECDLYAADESWVHFKSTSSGMIVSCRRVLCSYPCFDALMRPEGQEIQLPTELGASSKIAEDFGEVMIHLTVNQMLISGQSANGWFTEHFDVKYTGPEIKFGIDPKILRNAISRSDRCVVTDGRMVIDAGNYTYVSRLHVS